MVTGTFRTWPSLGLGGLLQRFGRRRQCPRRMPPTGVIGMQAGEARTPFGHHLLETSGLDMGQDHVFRQEGQSMA